MAESMGFEGPQAAAAATSSESLYKAVIECDCTMVEISPFAELTDGRVIVCDAKVRLRRHRREGVGKAKAEDMMNMLSEAALAGQEVGGMQVKWNEVFANLDS